MHTFPRSLIAAILILSLPGVATGQTAERGPGERGLVQYERTTIFETHFENTGGPLDLSAYEYARGAGRNNSTALTGKVENDEGARRLRIPFEQQGGNLLTLSYWARGERGVKTAVWIVKDGEERESVTSAEVHDHWHRHTAAVRVASDTSGYFEILAPNAWDGDPGRAWLDDLQLQTLEGVGFTREHTQDFPALTTDERGQGYLALIARPLPKNQIRVYRFDENDRQRIATLQAHGASRVGRPAIAPAAEGCFVAFAAYTDGRWRVAYAQVDDTGASQVRYLDPGGHTNVQPAVTRAQDGGGHWVVWESNAAAPRGVYAARVHRGGATAPTRISGPQPGNNPAITATEDGRLFAAWDAVHERQGHLYGAWHVDGEWQSPATLTGDPRIERHASLDSRNGQVWLAWELWSFKDHKVNNAVQQRIAVAQVKRDGLVAPKGMVEHVFGERWIIRPHIRFGPEGRLWLTARHSMTPNGGWEPLIWSYSGGTWSGPEVVWPQQGRWRPVSLTFGEAGPIAAVQRDDLPKWWRELGKHPAWHSDVVLRDLAELDTLAAASMPTTALALPATDFRLADHVEAFSLDLPRQHADHEGQELGLFWGDLHEHTSMSVCQRRLNPAAPDLFANQREIQNIDFTAITDHGYNIDQPRWAYTRAQVLANHDPGQFVSLLGEEWTSSQVPPPNADAPIGPDNFKRFGHRNIIFQDPQYPEFFDAYDGLISPEQVWRQLGDTEFIMVPHQIADWTTEGRNNPPTDWRHHHEHHQPLAEIFQKRGSYEALDAPRQAPNGAPFQGNYLQDAWEKGVVIGVIASPDHGGGLGLAGVWAPELTREALFEAFHARHTFGTSGAKISLLVKSGPHMMGEKVTGFDRNSIPFRIEAVTDKPIERVVILRNNEVVYTAKPGEGQVTVNWTDRNVPKRDRLWYYVRVERADGELAWASPIWFLR